MKNLKLHGDYPVGFKRIQSDQGNQLFVFYPTNKDSVETLISPFAEPEKSIQGMKDAKTIPFG